MQSNKKYTKGKMLEIFYAFFMLDHYFSQNNYAIPKTYEISYIKKL